MTTITARHDSDPEQLEAAIYKAASSGRPLLVRIHGFDGDALGVILRRLPRAWRIERGSAAVTIRAGVENTEPGGAVLGDATAVTFNGYVGNSGQELRANLTRMARAAGMPLVIAVQEARKMAGTIPGYVRYDAPGGGPDRGTNVLLVRHDADVVDSGHVDTGGGTYHGPGGGTRGEKVYPWVKIRQNGTIYRFLNVHKSTRTDGAADNRRAEDAAIRRWFDTGPDDAVSAALGDWNAGPDLMGALADAVGGVLSLFAPDGAIVRGGRIVTQRRFRRRFGSDRHRPIAYTFRAR